MGKRDLKAAFKLIPFRDQDCQLMAITLPGAPLGGTRNVAAVYLNMNFGWNEPGGTNYQVPGSDVDTAVGLLHRLRTLGVRAHFWI